MTRVIAGLKWAQLAPKAIHRPGRAKGAKGQGLRYERLLAKALPGAQHGVWFQYSDMNGLGACQTDLLAVLRTCVVVIEAKYTWVPEGHLQLEALYKPVVERVFGKPMLGIVVCKRLVPGMTGVHVAPSLTAAINIAQHGGRAVWHWLGAAAPMLDRVWLDELTTLPSKPLGPAELGL